MIAGVAASVAEPIGVTHATPATTVNALPAFRFSYSGQQRAAANLSTSTSNHSDTSTFKAVYLDLLLLRLIQ